jgi:hypothetical protein
MRYTSVKKTTTASTPDTTRISVMLSMPHLSLN